MTDSVDNALHPDSVPTSVAAGRKPVADDVRKHLLIAGTGRAGTSFLVKYLSELGLDTHLSKHGSHAYWDEHARAGLEDMPLVGDAGTLPYVVKSPYAYQFIDALLGRDDIKLDGVIIPIRDLNEAASSRALTEIHHLQQSVPWLPDLEETWEQWALTPGGVVYSLNVRDQARLLAQGFHHLVQRLVRAGIRIRFVHFPAMINDADYLFRQLQCFLPPTVSIEAARKAHAMIANPDDVRVGGELKTTGSFTTPGPDTATTSRSRTAPVASSVDDDAAAQRIESRLLRAEVKQLKEAGERQKTELTSLIAQNVYDLGRLSEELTRQTDQVRAVDTALIRAKLKIETDRQRIAIMRDDLAITESQIAAMHGTSSWRYTAPLRMMGRVMLMLSDRAGTSRPQL